MECSTCNFWHKPEGECRRRSPIVDTNALIGYHGNREIHGPKTRWPTTHSDQWCGDWLAKPKPTKPALISDEDWFKLPMGLRERWWLDTDYGKHPPSDELRDAVANALGKPFP